MMKLLAISGTLAALMSTAALAQEAEVTSDLNMRAGPGARFPIITTIPEGRTVEVYGCLNDYEWCDVGWRGNRGWVFTDYLDYYYRNQPRPVMEWGPRIGLPIITFSFGDYARRHYRNMPWYSDRDRWMRWDRDRRYRNDRRGDYRDDDDDNVRYYRERNRDFGDDDENASRTLRRYQADDNDGRNARRDDDEAAMDDDDNAGDMRRMPRGAQANDVTRCNPARENCTPGRSQSRGNSSTSDENNSQQNRIED